MMKICIYVYFPYTAPLLGAWGIRYTWGSFFLGAWVIRNTWRGLFFTCMHGAAVSRCAEISICVYSEQWSGLPSEFILFFEKPRSSYNTEVSYVCTQSQAISVG